MLRRRKRPGRLNLPLKLPKSPNFGPEEEQGKQAIHDAGSEAQARNEHEDEGDEVAGAEPHGDEAPQPDEDGGEEVDAAPVALADLAGHVLARHGEDLVVVGQRKAGAFGVFFALRRRWEQLGVQDGVGRGWGYLVEFEGGHGCEVVG